MYILHKVNSIAYNLPTNATFKIIVAAIRFTSPSIEISKYVSLPINQIS